MARTRRRYGSRGKKCYVSLLSCNHLRYDTVGYVPPANGDSVYCILCDKKVAVIGEDISNAS